LPLEVYEIGMVPDFVVVVVVVVGMAELCTGLDYGLMGII
jgi:preprotein translocase subunit SecE